MMMAVVQMAKGKVMNRCPFDEALNSLISMSCFLHVLQSIYIHQSVNKYSRRRSRFSPIQTNKQGVDLTMFMATITQDVLEEFLNDVTNIKF